MALFDPAVNETLKWEGGLVEDPFDPGGLTNFGITQKDHPGVDIRNLTVDQAKAIYREGYWKDWHGQILSQSVANKVFDFGVNAGVGTATKVVQAALGLPQDGVFGPNTLLEVNKRGDAFLVPLKVKLIEHYQAVVQAKPETIKFLAGWIRRANS
jgi:lysozyme family protein